MPNAKISAHIQKLDLGKRVTLAQVDLTKYGEGTLYWVSGDEGASGVSVTFNSQVYTPFPFEAKGFEHTGDGPLPRPTLAIADVSGIFTPLVLQNKNLVGSRFTRIRTFDRFLDGGADPDPLAVLPIETYILARKTYHAPGDRIQWELHADMDVAGSMLPARQMVRDFCDHSYRRYVSGSGAGAVFDYTKATCPYTDVGTTGVYFDENDVDTGSDASKDKCSKRLTGGCKGRFGANAELPFRGFPGISRIRVAG